MGIDGGCEKTEDGSNGLEGVVLGNHVVRFLLKTFLILLNDCGVALNFVPAEEIENVSFEKICKRVRRRCQVTGLH